MRKTIGTIVVILLFVACAKEAPDPLTGMNEISFRRWIAKNAPSAQEIEDGVFIEFIKKGDINLNLKPDVDSSFVQYSYTCTNFDGTVIMTRYENVSHLVGSWVKTTHWCADYSPLSGYYATINYGLGRALLDMREGDSARVYVPQKYALTEYFMDSFNSGYLGEMMGKYVGVPVCFTVKLERIINKPREYELETLNAFAANEWGLELKDTVAGGLYFRKITDLPEADTIAKSENTIIDHTHYFLDHFIISTTNDSIARLENIYVSTKDYAPETSVNLNATDVKGLKKMFMKILPHMRYGEEVEVVCTSDWTDEGNAGKIANIPQLNPFTQRIIKIWVRPKVEKKE